MKRLIARIRDQKGVTVPEYAIMLALISVAVIAATPTLKEGILDIFDYIATNLTTALGGVAG